jgi:hypothetical protein
LLHTSWKVFPGGPRLPLSVWVSIPVTLAGSQIFSLITQVCLAYKGILNQITCFESHGEFLKSWVVFQGGLRSFWGLQVSILICDTTLPKSKTSHRPVNMRPEFHSPANLMEMGLWYCTTQGYDSKTSHWLVNMRLGFHSLAKLMGMDLWYCPTQGYNSKTSYWPVNMRPGFHSQANLMEMGLWYCTTQGYHSKTFYCPINMRSGLHLLANQIGMGLWYYINDGSCLVTLCWLVSIGLGCYALARQIGTENMISASPSIIKSINNWPLHWQWVQYIHQPPCLRPVTGWFGWPIWHGQFSSQVSSLIWG